MFLLPIIAVITVVIVMLLKGKQILSRVKKTNRLKYKIEAEAIILSIQPTGIVYNNDMLQVKLQMQVQPDQGRNFIVENRQVISPADMATVRQGSRIIVEYNPVNHKEIIFLAVV
jgi:hypothetical protein